MDFIEEEVVIEAGKEVKVQKVSLFLTNIYRIIKYAH